MRKFVYLAVIALALISGCVQTTPEPLLTDDPTLEPTSPVIAEIGTPTQTAVPILSMTPPATVIPPFQGEYYREVAWLDMKGRILEIMLSPDQTRIAALTWDGVYLFDTMTLELYWHYAERIGIPHGIAWLGNTEIILLRRYNAYVINAGDGSYNREIDYISLEGATIPAPSGKYFAKYNVVDPYTVYDALTGEILLTFEHLLLPSHLFVWMPDGEHVIFADSNLLTIRNVATGEIVKQIEVNLPHYFDSLGSGFSPDGRFFALQASHSDESGQSRLTTWLWNLETGQSLSVEELSGYPSDHGWILDDQAILLSHGLVVRLTELGGQATALPFDQYFRAKDGLFVMKPDAIVQYDANFNRAAQADGHNSAGCCEAESSLSPSGTMLAIGEGTRYYVWDIERTELLTAFIDLDGFHGAFADWSPSGRTLAIGTHLKGQLHLWDAASRSSLQTFETGYHICRVEWLDEELIALALTDYQTPYDHSACAPTDGQDFFAIFNTELGQITYLEPTSLKIYSLAASPDGKCLLIVEISRWQPDTEIYAQAVIWDTVSQQKLTIEGVDWTQGVYWLTSSRVVMPDESTMRIFDIDTEQEQTIAFEVTYDNLFGKVIAISNEQLLEIDNLGDQIIWFDVDGNSSSENIAFWMLAGNVVVTPDHRILAAIYPDTSEVIVLVEFIPPN